VTITVSKGVEEVTVPDVVGDTEEDATAKLVAAGFKVNAVSQPTPLIPNDKDDVIAQSPDGGDKAKKGSTVTITVASDN
jgi:eukaryotic-like serine/threonine-protein kinase